MVAQSRAEQVNRTADFREKAQQQFDQAADTVENAVSALSERGREATENVQKVADNFKSAVDSSVRQQPLTTLAAAAVIGFVLGALWKS